MLSVFSELVKVSFDVPDDLRILNVTVKTVPLLALYIPEKLTDEPLCTRLPPDTMPPCE